MSLVLAVDVGTTTMKIAVVEDGRQILSSAERSYPMTLRRGGHCEIDTGLWWDAFLSCCDELKPDLADVQVVSFSVSTPGATALGANGEALSPAVLFLDGRSREQAQQIRDQIGEDVLLQTTSNLPVSGGCTAATILWWRQHAPDIFHQASYFGHTNTLFGKRLTGQWGMDPSTASLTALYNTTTNDKSWNAAIVDSLNLPMEKLPPIIDSGEPVGELLPKWAQRTGLSKGIPILMGGNDAICAALNGGVTYEGAILDVCGTCEIICVGLSQSVPGCNYNVRCHLLPYLWSTLYVLNTGGKALEWFHQHFCREMTAGQFFTHYIPDTIHDYFQSTPRWKLPHYQVFLAGDRYSTQKKHAAFQAMDLETSREKLLMAMIKGNNRYLARHLRELGKNVLLTSRIHVTGGGLNQALIRCKKEWMGDFYYVLKENSSLMGAAQLGHYYLTGEETWECR